MRVEAPTQERTSIHDHFVHLPLSQKLNLEFLSPFVKNVDPKILTKTIENRYLDLFLLCKKYNYRNPPVVNNEMAVALLDVELFEAIKQEFQTECETLTVARHEVGHELVAHSLGWNIESVTVVPGATYLGLTVTSPSKELPLYNWALESAAISFGGAIAAQMSSDKVQGHGSDFASAHAKARLVASLPELQMSEAAFLAEAQNLAHMALKSFSAESLNRQAHELLHQKTAA